MVKVNKLWIRFFTVFFIHIVIKSFDLSFPNGPFALDVRSVVFTVFFVSYGLVVWYIAEWFYRQVQRIIPEWENSGGKMLIATVIHACFAWIIMVLFNFLYRYGDVYFFGNEEDWINVPPLNPNLTLSLTAIYLTILGFDNYARIQNKLQARELETTRLQKENITAQYRALKAQIEPHFLFNSLSVLSSLVYENADLSADFIVKLSKTLRYIIEKNKFNLVKLSEELKFLDAYFFLVKTRLEKGVFLINKLEDSFINTNYIPPVTLQLLVENAINHNAYNPHNPLKIIIEEKDGFIVVSNNLNPRELLKESTKQGLKNIAKRYSLIGEKEVEIRKTETDFIVKLPLLNEADYESINI